jgi:prolyl-tRNA synthetase
MILDLYETFAREHLALPVIKGEKTPDERFPGADQTYTIEVMTQDGKALQAGTSHFLGQNFAKASHITFLDKDGELKTAWTTSWGVTTRLIGALVMTHGDDDGIILPPRVATQQIILLPIHRQGEEDFVLDYCEKLRIKLMERHFHGQGLRVKIDNRDMRGGNKVWHHIKKGAPLRIEIGARDIKSDKFPVGMRHKSPKDKLFVSEEQLLHDVVSWLEDCQAALFERAKNNLSSHTKVIESKEGLTAFFAKPVSGFALCWWHELAIGHPLLEELKITPRAHPLNDDYLPTMTAPGRCPLTGEPTSLKVIYAKAY